MPCYDGRHEDEQREPLILVVLALTATMPRNRTSGKVITVIPSDYSPEIAEVICAGIAEGSFYPRSARGPECYRPLSSFGSIVSRVF